MKNQRLKVLALSVIAAGAPLGARAAYDDVGISPRAVGMGNAFTAVADDAYAIYYNPAGLATLDRPELSASYARLLTGLSDNSNISNSFLAYEHPLQEGRQGTVGAALNYFSLQGLYQETSFFGSYAHGLFESYVPNQLFGGLSLKVLNRSVSAGSSATQPIDNAGNVVPGIDPVLQHASKTNLDVDWGLLYRPQPHWSLGLAVQHFLEPNIAFSPSDTDRLGRNVKLGAAYRTPWSTLSLDVDFPTAPDGSLDKTAAIAAEKWLPTLLYGTVGIRGSLAAGTRDYRQLGLGVSYKIFRMQFDYGFNIPLGGLSTAGSHRFGLTYRFGRSKAPQPTVGEAILENIQDLAEVGSPEFHYQVEELTLFKRTAIDEFLRQAKVDVGSGKFAEAASKVAEVASLKPGDAKIAASLSRLKLVSDVYPEVEGFFTEPAQAAVYDGAVNFLAGKDQEALGNLVYAQGLNSGEPRIEALMKAIEAKTGLKRAAAAAQAPSVAVATVTAPAPAPTVAVSSPAVAVSSPTAAPAPAAPAPAPAVAAPATPAPSAEATLAAHKKQLVEGYMALMEVAFRQYEYDKVIQLAKQVTELDDSNVLAYKRMGAAYHALKHYPQALAALQKAFQHESDGESRKNLRSYIIALQGLIKRSREVAQAARPEAAPAPKPACGAPAEVESLYEQGVEAYSRGQLKEAADDFRRILGCDSGNKSARLALRRVEAELVQSGEAR